MRRSFVRRTGIAAAAVVLSLLGSGVAASAADVTGSISGVFTDSHGNPIAGADVEIWLPDQEEFVTNTATDDSGAYTVDVPAGDYIVEFGSGSMVQWAHQQLDSFNATVFSVQSGADTTVDEAQLPMGTFTGTLTNTDGSPAIGVNVVATGTSGFPGFANTDDSGQWAIQVPAGDSYVVSFALDGLTQYVPGQISRDAAEQFALAADQTVGVDDQLLPTGVITGRYTTAAGRPDANAQVFVNTVDGDEVAFASTDATGMYSTPVFAGSYNVGLFGSDNKLQYAFGQLTAATAAKIDVTANGTAEVDDAQIATGTVTVTATDGTTGASISNFCAFIDSERACAKGTGVAVVKNVRQGTQELDVSPNIKYLSANTAINVAVTAGQNVDANIVFQPAAVIRSTIVDAQTGAAVPNACVLPFVPGFTVWPDSSGYCSDANGVVKIAPLFGNTYSLFVNAPEGSTYGDQWVGKTGGTGLEKNARVITAPAGKTTSIPPIRLDRAGTITGLVTNGPGGTPIARATVGPNTVTPGVGASGNDVATDSSGRYTLSGLGPYQWPIFAAAPDLAGQWTGGVGNRHQAQTVQVTVGASVTNDIAMSAGVTLHGTALKPDGTSFAQGGYIVAYNVKTGDVMGYAYANADGTYSMQLSPGQSVRIGYLFQDESTLMPYDGFVGGTSAATAEPINIPARGRTIDIVLLPGENI
jgi:Carboxypeptidase regulatory-like domain